MTSASQDSTPRYLAAALLVSVLWYPALLLDPTLSGLLLGDLEIGRGPAFLFLVIAGLTTSLVFRKWIRRARKILHFVLAALLPLFAAEVFGICVALAGLVREWPESPLVPMFWSVWFALKAFYLVLPMGMLSQTLLHRASTGRWPLSKEVRPG